MAFSSVSSLQTDSRAKPSSSTSRFSSLIYWLIIFMIISLGIERHASCSNHVDECQTRSRSDVGSKPDKDTSLQIGGKYSAFFVELYFLY